MKKIFQKVTVKGIVVIMFVCLFNVCHVQAASQIQIYADDVEIKAEKHLQIPVYIKNNTGIMGYMIVVKYDSEKLKIKGISAGDLSANGVFDDNLSLNKKNEVKILWSYTKEIKEDGTLFFLEVEADSKLDKDKTQIELRCLQEDTFNEKYQSVKIFCKPIQIKGREYAEKEQNSRADENNTERDDEKTDAGKKKTTENKTDNRETGERQKTEREQSGNKKKGKEEERSQGKPAEETRKNGAERKEERIQGKETPETISGRSINVKEAVKKKENADVEENVSQPQNSGIKGWIAAGGICCVLVVMGIVFLVKKRETKAKMM